MLGTARWSRRIRGFCLLVPGILLTAAAAGESPAIVRREFLYETPPTPACHASTIAEAADAALVAAWFGGTREGHADVGIWVARQERGAWSTPVEVANGVQPDGKRYPCWNPVLFQPQRGPLLLFYKIGPSPTSWWGLVRTSADAGRTWGEASRLPDGILGPIKNKPLQLDDGTLLCPSSVELPRMLGVGPVDWRIHFERSGDLGKTWNKLAPAVPQGASPIAAIQPSILRYGPEKLQAVGRTRGGKLFETWSADAGRTWTPLAYLEVPNPNSGIDAVTLRDGRQLLVYNHTDRGRSPLNVALSHDGKTWTPALVLEDTPGKEFSYPAAIQTRDGLVHITYSWKRERVRHVVVDPANLKP